ncbi:MAG: T9SS type A sorting domain-containing protein [Candidatus Kapaibacteriota bacterium]
MKKLSYFFLISFFGTLTTFSQPMRFESRGMGGGAEFHSLSISPFSPFTMRVSGGSSQLFTSIDLGATWNAIQHGNISGGGFAGKVTFTSSPLIQYAISDQKGLDIPVKSTDGGRTWIPIYDPTFGGAYSIHADPAATNRLILSDYTDVYFSSDGGANWTIAFSELTEGADGCYIAGVLFDGDYIMVATQAGIYTSEDGGLSFMQDPFYDLPIETGIISFQYASSGNLYRLICLTGPMEILYPGIEADEITTFDDLFVMDVINGVSDEWISKKNALPQDFLPNQCVMSINDPSRIFLSGTDAAEQPMIVRSTNGGTTFQSMFKTTNNQNVTTGWIGSGSQWNWSHAGTPLTLAIAQKNSQYVGFGDYASLHISTDAGENWRQAYTRSADQNPAGTLIPTSKSYQSNGLDNTTIHDILHVDSSTILAGMDIGGIMRSTDNGRSWNAIQLPTTFGTCYALEMAGSTVYAAMSERASLYSVINITDSILNTAKSVLLRSTDKGNTWSIAQEFGSTIFTLCADPQKPNTMYAGLVHSTKGGILVNDNVNGKGMWKNLSNPPRTEGHPYSIVAMKDGTIITTFTARRSGSQLTQSSGVFSTVDGGTTWSDHSIDAMKVWTTSISVDPHDPYRNTWYACTWSNPLQSTDNSGGVYRTTNRGNSWTRLLTLPQDDGYSGNVNACTMSPIQPSLMYVGTATHGLYASQNAQSASPVFSELAMIFPARASRTFSFHPNAQWDMHIGTDGNGLRFGTHQIPAIPILNASIPDRDTIIEHKKGERPFLSIRATLHSKQTKTQAQARFSKTRAFTVADTTDIINEQANHFPFNILGGDEIVYMQCRIGNNSGWGSWSEAIKISFKEINTSSVNEESSITGISPHPVKDELLIQKPSNRSYSIYAINGAFIMFGMTNTPLDVSSLPTGIYTVRITDDETLRFIKQ